MTCPACNHKKSRRVSILVERCTQCEAIFNRAPMSLGDSYKYVLPRFTHEETPIDRQRHFDFQCLSSEGLIRRHGWFDPETRLITQTG